MCAKKEGPGIAPRLHLVSDNHISFLHILQHFDSLQALPWRGLWVVPNLAECIGLGLDFLHLLALALSPGLLVALAGFLSLFVAFIDFKETVTGQGGGFCFSQ